MIYGEYILAGSTEDLDQLRHNISSPMERMRGISTADHAYLFNRPNERGSYRKPLGIRRMSVRVGSTVYPPPLFSGMWDFNSYVWGSRTEIKQTYTRLHLHLNPTRYVRHQLQSPLPDPEGSRWPAARMYGEKGEPEINGEISLTGNDNLIPESRRFDRFAHTWVQFPSYLSGRWTAQVGGYLGYFGGRTNA